MRRREFINIIGGAAAWPLAARAEPADRMRRIGVLMPYANDNSEARERLAAFLQELKQLGWNVGHNLQIDYRWDTGDPDFGRKAATELVALSPDVILATATTAVTALQPATRTVPIAEKSKGSACACSRRKSRA